MAKLIDYTFNSDSYEYEYEIDDECRLSYIQQYGRRRFRACNGTVIKDKDGNSIVFSLTSAEASLILDFIGDDIIMLECLDSAINDDDSFLYDYFYNSAFAEYRDREVF